MGHYFVWHIRVLKYIQSAGSGTIVNIWKHTCVPCLSSNNPPQTRQFTSALFAVHVTVLGDQFAFLTAHDFPHYCVGSRLPLCAFAFSSRLSCRRMPCWHAQRRKVVSCRGTGERASSSRMGARFECIVAAVSAGALSTWIGWQGRGGSSCKVLMLLSKHHFTKTMRINGQVVEQRPTSTVTYNQSGEGSV